MARSNRMVSRSFKLEMVESLIDLPVLLDKIPNARLQPPRRKTWAAGYDEITWLDWGATRLVAPMIELPKACSISPA